MEKLQIVVNLSKDTVRKIIKHDINLEELITKAVRQEILRSRTPQEEEVADLIYQLLDDEEEVVEVVEVIDWEGRIHRYMEHENHKRGLKNTEGEKNE